MRSRPSIIAPAMPPSSQTQARPIRRELSLAELHADIARCLWGAENGGTSQARKAFKRLKWLEEVEEIREKLHGIPPSRRIPVAKADHGQAHAPARIRPDAYTGVLLPAHNCPRSAHGP